MAVAESMKDCCASRSCAKHFSQNKDHFSQGMFCAEISQGEPSKATHTVKRKRKPRRKFDPDLFLIKGSSSPGVSSHSSANPAVQSSYLLEDKHEATAPNSISSAPENKENLSLTNTLLQVSSKNERVEEESEAEKVVFKIEKNSPLPKEVVHGENDQVSHAGPNLTDIHPPMEDHLNEGERGDVIFSEQSPTKDALDPEELPKQNLIFKSLKSKKAEDPENEYEETVEPEDEDEEEGEDDILTSETADKKDQIGKKKLGKNPFIKRRKPLSSTAIAG